MDTTIIIDKYASVLRSLGDLQSAVDLALQRYTIEQITSKVAELREKEAGFRAKYGSDYQTFRRRIAEDEEFISQIESKVNKLWEIDLAEWEFCYKGIEDWREKLQTILLMS